MADDAKLVPGQNPLISRLPPVSVTWTKFRGPGDVTFSNSKPPAAKTAFTPPPNATFTGKATTTATFNEPGEYILRIGANDWTGEGGGGFQCCWTGAFLKVTAQ